MKLMCTVLAVFSICFASSGVVEAKQPQMNREAAIKIAGKNLQTLKKPLPNGYRVFVNDGKAYVEVKPTRDTFVVEFTVAHGRKWRVIYVVDVDKQSGKVSAFTDYRDVKVLIP
jgi:hypothetical protein